jgi:hypothetical protein
MISIVLIYIAQAYLHAAASRNHVVRSGRAKTKNETRISKSDGTGRRKEKEVDKSWSFLCAFLLNTASEWKQKVNA